MKSKYRIIQRGICYFEVQKRIWFLRITIGNTYGYLDAEKMISRDVNPYIPKVTDYDEKGVKLD